MARTRYGRYETLRPIASGGMGRVYLGRAVGAGGFERLVAIKVMHDHIAEQRELVAAFLDEARLAAQIRHPNVVPTLDVADDGRFLVMEYVEGASLKAVLEALDAGERLPLPVVLRIMHDALEGLHAAHELADRDGRPLRLVHRDISPHNLLVGVDGVTRITDFGIAHAESRLTTTKSGQLKGKVPYMAPEQLRDEPLDRRTDVYAAGCVLWEALTGERLFRADNEAALLCAIMAGPRARPRELAGDVPLAIDEVCMRALGPAERRYDSAEAFASALDHAAESCELSVARPRAVAPFAKRVRLTIPPLTLADADMALPTDVTPSHEQPAPTAPTRELTAVREPSLEREVATPPQTVRMTASERALDAIDRPAPSTTLASMELASAGTDAAVVSPVALRVPARRMPRRVLVLGGAGLLLAGGIVATQLEWSEAPLEPPVLASAAAPATVSAPVDERPLPTASVASPPSSAPADAPASLAPSVAAPPPRVPVRPFAPAPAPKVSATAEPLYHPSRL